MTKKPLETLLEEVRIDLENILVVLNSLKEEVPTKIKEELDKVPENINLRIKKIATVQRDKFRKLNEYLAKASQTLASLEAKAEQIRQDYEILKKDYKKTLWKLEGLYPEIKKTIREVQSSIESYAYNGVKRGIENGIEEAINQIENALERLNETAEELNSQFQTYRWSWVGVILISNFILFLTIIGLGSFLLQKETFLQYLLGLLETIFFLIGAYAVWKLSNSYPKRWIAYLTSVLLLAVAGFVGYTTFKDKIVITRQVACDLPKPDKVLPQKDGRVCYLYSSGYFRADDGNWYKSPVVICK